MLSDVALRLACELSRLGVSLLLLHLRHRRLRGEQHHALRRAEPPLGAGALVGEKLIEDVVVALARCDLDDARSLEEVRLARGADDDRSLVVLHGDVLAKSGRVVVTDRLGVAKGLEHL